jgi:NADPH-dependent curcumin reductase
MESNCPRNRSMTTGLVSSVPPVIPERFARWVVAAQAPVDGELALGHFRREVVQTPRLRDGQALVRVKLVNIHSATRLRMVRGAIPVGDTDRNNYALGQVVASRNARFSMGDLVACQAGWQEYDVIDSQSPPVGFAEPHELVKALNGTSSPWTYVMRPALAKMWPTSVLMDIFGTSGMTAWFGIREYGPLMPTDGVLVAAATGSVGSIFAQLAKAAGGRVIGIAGGPDRCGWVTQTLGVDGCLDYRAPTFEADLAAAFPSGIDVFSDGVGGSLTELVTRQLKRNGRLFSYGGAAASYAPRLDAAPAIKPTMRQNFGISEIVEQRIRRHNIKSGAWTVDLFYHERPRAEDDLARLMVMGQLRSNSRVVPGFDCLPQAIVDLYREPRGAKLQVAFE